MKKQSFIILIALGVFTSCSSDTEEFESAAKEICSCMRDKEVGVVEASLVDLKIGFCLLDAEVDLKSPEMKQEIGKQCPEFIESFSNFIKGLK